MHISFRRRSSGRRAATNIVSPVDSDSLTLRFKLHFSSEVQCLLHKPQTVTSVKKRFSSSNTLGDVIDCVEQQLAQVLTMDSALCQGLQITVNLTHDSQTNRYTRSLSLPVIDKETNDISAVEKMQEERLSLAALGISRDCTAWVSVGKA
jgi:hypothetical protein